MNFRPPIVCQPTEDAAGRSPNVGRHTSRYAARPSMFLLALEWELELALDEVFWLVFVAPATTLAVVRV